MVKTLHNVLSRRERQIVDILYRRGRATAADVMEDLPGDPSYSTVRTQLRVLEDKGHVHHEEVGLRYVYLPKVPRHTMGQSALRHLIDTFFEGSSGKVMAALIGDERTRISSEELSRLEELIEKARKAGTSLRYLTMRSDEKGRPRYGSNWPLDTSRKTRKRVVADGGT